MDDYAIFMGGGWKYGLLWTNVVLLALTSGLVGATLRDYSRGNAVWRTKLAGGAITAAASLALLALL